jgi:uncharacterized FAD-dependent dehydrogenase
MSQIKTLSGIKLGIQKSETELFKIVEKKLGKKPSYFAILKKSLDARNKNDLHYVYTVEYAFEKPSQNEQVLSKIPAYKAPENPVLVVGSGPAGLFCALRLLERGFIPHVVERGDCVEVREQKTRDFALHAKLDTESNVQFGEGGAGTFSDGKLNTRTHGPLNGEVLKTFVKFGAPQEILWLNKPHIGSDNLKNVVKNMRQFIIEQGGRVEFNTKLVDIRVKDGKLVSAVLSQGGTQRVIEPSALVLAVGHSARDTFEMLLSRGVYMRQKDFAVGARIEHLQSQIGFAQYGKSYLLLPAADYQLTSHASERATFTFCMCPGGYVMPAASEEGGVVTNGMSNYARDGLNANSALIVQVTGKDFGEGALAGVEFQRKIERAAYLAGGSNYRAPVQRVGDFLEKKNSSKFGAVMPTFGCGTQFAQMDDVLPSGVCDAMRLAILDMDKKLKGFACPDALLTAAETRTSSPVRMERGENLQSVSVEGLYPCGEGAGYAGGITSSAADGIRVADGIFAYFNA